MDSTTLASPEDFPRRLEAYDTEVPADFKNWRPSSWEGIPSEPFTPIEQVCHVRDIEVDGYHVRFRRTLQESNPTLLTLDGERLARERRYADHQHLAGLQWLLANMARVYGAAGGFCAAPQLHR